MEGEKITHTQLTALVWAGVLAPAAELLPALTLPMAGRGAWLAPAAAIPLVLLGGWLLGRMGGPAKIRSALGPVFGSAILTVYIVWGELLLALRLRLCAQRLLAAGERDGSLWFFLLGAVALTLWMGTGRLAAFARAGQVFLAVLLAAAGAVLLLSLPQVRLERLLPLWREDVRPVMLSALPAAGALGWGLWGAFLVEETAPPEGQGSWRPLFWGVGGCLVLALAQAVILGNLGQALAAQLANPFFALTKSVGVEGAFQRVESLVAALWTLADLTMACLLLFALRALIRTLLPAVKERWAASVALVLTAALALTFFAGGRAELWSREIVPAGNLFLVLAVPGAVLLTGRRRRE